MASATISRLAWNLSLDCALMASFFQFGDVVVFRKKTTKTILGIV
jgi:hypothetical protein